MRSLTVQTIQINASYGNQYYFPYSVGVLESYFRHNSAYADQVTFNLPLYRRTSLAESMAAIGTVDVLAVSCYVWNWRLSLATIEAVKAQQPNCFVIVGGPHIPLKDDTFLQHNPAIDVCVAGEGEESFRALLEARLLNGAAADLSGIDGILFRNVDDGTTVRTRARPRMRDISELPSPYLDGTFDRLIAQNKQHEWMAIWETNRGCPFSCTFCDWGSATNSKVVEIHSDRLWKEIEWFGRNEIRYIFGADANFGIRKRDTAIAEALIAAKEKYGYPRDFRVCFTKNSTQKIFNLAKLFHDSEMLRGVSLSLQSLNQPTLSAIKRDNIKAETFRQLQSHYNAEGVATYTELIMGLPGESYESFVSGIDTLLEQGQHSQIIIYNCTVMPNAEMGDPAYRAEHGIETVEIPIFTSHASTKSQDGPPEFAETEAIVVTNKTMGLVDWKRSYRFAWAVQCFHTLGLTQYVALFLRHYYAVTYREFYEGLLSYAEKNPGGRVGREDQRLNHLLDDVLAGIGFDQTVPGYGEIIWPAEEASLLRLSEDFDGLYIELRRFVDGLLAERLSKGPENELLDALFDLQRAVIVGWQDQGDTSVTAPADIYRFVQAARNGDPEPLLRRPYTYHIHRAYAFFGQRGQYAKEIVWYGRKGGRFLYSVKATPAKEDLIHVA